VVVGNDRRIKIWNQDNELLCDYNINVIKLLFSTLCLTNGTCCQQVYPSQHKKYTMVLKLYRVLLKNIKMIFPLGKLRI